MVAGARGAGSAGGWIWAVFAPLVAIAVYTMAFTTNLQLPLLTFSASWLASPDTVAVELVADLAGKIAQSSALVDAPALARH